jgi:hypothetical protein
VFVYTPTRICTYKTWKCLGYTKNDVLLSFPQRIHTQTVTFCTPLFPPRNTSKFTYSHTMVHTGLKCLYLHLPLLSSPPKNMSKSPKYRRYSPAIDCLADTVQIHILTYILPYKKHLLLLSFSQEYVKISKIWEILACNSLSSKVTYSHTYLHTQNTSYSSLSPQEYIKISKIWEILACN